MKNSSLFWSIMGVLAIFVLAIMAINGVKNGPTRNTFKQIKSSTNIGSSTPSVNQVLREGGESKVQNVADSQNQSINLSNGLFDKSTKLNFDTNGVQQKTITPVPVSWNENAIQTGANENNYISEPTFEVNITPELLRQAGFEHFIIKIKPFSGKILNLMELNAVNTDQIKEFSIDLGNNQSMLIDQIRSGNQDLNNEFFTFLKSKFSTTIGTKINQTNQFGSASFYINFEIPNDNVFLVVRYKTIVYALSYPRAKGSQNGIDNQVKNLLMLFK